MRVLSIVVSVLLLSVVLGQQGGQRGSTGGHEQPIPHGPTGVDPLPHGPTGVSGLPVPVPPAHCEVKPVECAEGELPKMGEGACPSCIPKRAAEAEERVIGGDKVKKCTTMDTIAECAEGVTPKRDATTGCPTCKLAIKPIEEPCSPAQMEALPECAADANAQVMERKLPGGGCPACKRAPMPVCTVTDIPDCSASEHPEFNKATGCLSCKVPNPFAGCTKEKFAACALDQVPECADDVKPTIVDCCPTCKHTPPAHIPDPEKADHAAKIDARPDCAAVKCADMSTLPVCTPGAKPFKVKSDADVEADAAAAPAAPAAPVPPTPEQRCCRPCREAPIPKPPAGDRAKCTKDEMDKCLASVADCAEGEHPKPVNGSCCKSCKRVERKCTPEQVAACVSEAPVCADGVKPERLEASPCCMSCRPPAPVCDPVCADGEVCVPTHVKPAGPSKTEAAADASVTVAVTAPTGKCVAAKTQEIEVKVDTTVLLESVTDPATAAELVKEAVNRFCDRADQTARCTEGAKNIIHNATVAVGVDEKKNGRIRIDVPNPEEMEDIPAEEKNKDHIKIIIDALHDNAAVPRVDIHVNANRTKCEVGPKDLPVCAEGETPAMNFTTFCHSCRPAGPFEGCTEEQKAACTKHADLPECAADVKPPSIVNCCETCKPKPPTPPVPPCGKVCDMSAVAECAADQKPEFDEASCCPSCKHPRPPVEKPVALCTPEEMESCLETVAVCAEGQKPQKVEGACCMSCKRAARLCSKELVANCTAQAPECAADQKPEHAEGSCCPSCRPPKPVCTPACAEDEICAGPPTAHVCEPKKRLLVNITAPPHLCEHVMNMGVKDNKKGPKEMEELVKEMVRRSCDKAANETKCKAVEEHLPAINVTKVVPKGPCAVNVTVDVSDAVVPVIADTTGDVEATEFTVTASVGEVSAVSANEASSAAGVSAAVVGAIVAAVVVAVIVAVIVVRRRRVATDQQHLELHS